MAPCWWALRMGSDDNRIVQVEFHNTEFPSKDVQDKYVRQGLSCYNDDNGACPMPQCSAVSMGEIRSAGIVCCAEASSAQPCLTCLSSGTAHDPRLGRRSFEQRFIGEASHAAYSSRR